MYESSLRHPVRVPEINVNPCNSVVTCRDFLALPFLAPEGREFPAVSVVSGRDFPGVAFLAWVL
jgi:hypothetical protein